MSERDDNTSPVRVLIVEDHAGMRRILGTVLSQFDHFQIVAEAEDGTAAVQIADEVDPDVVVMDISLPDINGFEATRRIKALHPEVRIVAFSNHTDKASVESMCAAGAGAYVAKEEGATDLIPAIRAVMLEQEYFSDKVAHD